MNWKIKDETVVGYLDSSNISHWHKKMYVIRTIKSFKLSDCTNPKFEYNLRVSKFELVEPIKRRFFIYTAKYAGRHPQQFRLQARNLDASLLYSDVWLKNDYSPESFDPRREIYNMALGNMKRELQRLMVEKESRNYSEKHGILLDKRIGSTIKGISELKY